MYRRPILRTLFALIILIGLFGSVPAFAQGGEEDAPLVITVRLEGALHPLWLEQLKRARQVAERRGADAIVVELDTPGGEIGLMDQIVKDIRASEIPVIVYVTPRGAMAASAGTILTLAGHASGMAPETTIGAASPVDASGGDIEETMASKVRETLKATVRSLTVHRPPEAVRLAEQMIDDARAVSVDEAVEIGLVDVKANNISDLLNQLDGREVTVQDAAIRLDIAGADVEEVQRTFLEEILLVLTNPNITFLLISIGTTAIFIEMSSPGGWVAGFVGVVCILLGIYGIGALPVNWFGILFLIMAFILFLLDIKAPTHGALTAAGVASFIFGGLILFNSPNVPEFQRASVPLIVGTGVAIGLIFFAILGYALRSIRVPTQMGRNTLIGQIGVVNTPLAPVGTIQLGSELWTAVMEDHEQAARGERVEVVALDNLRVRVRRIKDQNPGEEEIK